ncbi:MAG TPA: AzlD domain-containing protein [Massilibacterium sp.]|nr:AzlD domain-containing protein [Massilibacterium sp.]
MDLSLFLIIIGMAIVTYIPRMIPLVFFSNLKLSPFVEGVLSNVPYAMLGALIIPGIFLENDDIWFGIIGLVVASVVSYLGGTLVLVILSAVFSVYLYSLFLL